MSDLDPRRLVFVGGLHRSGTTPFARALAEHPDIAGITDSPAKEGEGQHLQTVYPKAKVYGGSGRFAHAAAAHLTEDSPLVTPESARSLVESWRPYWDTSRRLLVEKSPPNIIMGRFLQALFPGSAFIVVVRHPVTVALSNKKWRRFASADPRKFESLSSLVEHWVTAHELLAADLPHLERALVIHYEDLVARPKAVLEHAEAFLGLSSPLALASLSAGHSSGYAQQWDAYSSIWRPGGWQRRRIERRFGDVMAQYGYDAAHLTAHQPSEISPLGAWLSPRV